MHQTRESAAPRILVLTATTSSAPRPCAGSLVPFHSVHCVRTARASYLVTTMTARMAICLNVSKVQKMNPNHLFPTWLEPVGREQPPVPTWPLPCDGNYHLLPPNPGRSITVHREVLLELHTS